MIVPRELVLAAAAADACHANRYCAPAELRTREIALAAAEADACHGFRVMVGNVGQFEAVRGVNTRSTPEQVAAAVSVVLAKDLPPDGAEIEFVLETRYINGRRVETVVRAHKAPGGEIVYTPALDSVLL